MDVLKSAGYLEELLALFKFKLGKCDTIKPRNKSNSDIRDTLQTCFTFLDATSRSFSAVIQALDGELRDAVCIFYLVLRALDTVEDDMTIALDEKIPMLRDFHTYLLKPDWTYSNSKEKDRIVLEQFTTISCEFRRLAPLYRDVISDICARMGNGMIEYLDKAPATMTEWNQYCHYVAGLVGIGLSRLFSASGLEAEEVGLDEDLANSMGLFLQKTNIIRDYLEDVVDKREFWPKEAWGKYVPALVDLSQPCRRQDAVTCLNELITHALQHVPDVLEYLTRLQNQSVFNFCAIPQVMAIATLERCYNNPHVFTGVVKIRKGEAVRLMMEATSMDKVKAIFGYFLRKIQNRVSVQDTCAHETNSIIDRSQQLTNGSTGYDTTSLFLPVFLSCAMLTSAVLWQYWTYVVPLTGNMELKMM